MAYGFSAPGFSWHGFSTEPPIEPPEFVMSGPGYRIVLPISLQRQRLEDDELFVFLVGSMLTQGLLK